MICKLFNKCFNVPIIKYQDVNDPSLSSVLLFFKNMFSKIYLYVIASLIIVFTFRKKIKDVKNY